MNLLVLTPTRWHPNLPHHASLVSKGEFRHPDAPQASGAASISLVSPGDTQRLWRRLVNFWRQNQNHALPPGTFLCVHLKLTRTPSHCGQIGTDTSVVDNLGMRLSIPFSCFRWGTPVLYLHHSFAVQTTVMPLSTAPGNPAEFLSDRTGCADP